MKTTPTLAALQAQLSAMADAIAALAPADSAGAPAPVKNRRDATGATAPVTLGQLRDVLSVAQCRADIDAISIERIPAWATAQARELCRAKRQQLAALRREQSGVALGESGFVLSVPSTDSGKAVNLAFRTGETASVHLRSFNASNYTDLLAVAAAVGVDAATVGGIVAHLAPVMREKVTPTDTAKRRTILRRTAKTANAAGLKAK